MDYLFEKKWQETLEVASKNFGEKLDYSAILLLIGLQELGIFDLKFKKDQKLELMHIAVCTLLEPYGYYEFEGRDVDGWPHSLLDFDCNLSGFLFFNLNDTYSVKSTFVGFDIQYREPSLT